MANPLALFDPELNPPGLFDPELSLGGWFDREFDPLSGGSAGTSVVLRFQMPSFTDHPFCYPMVSDRVTVGWDVTNVSNIKVYAVGVDGSRKLITDNVQDTFRIPNGDSVKWNTSLIEDFGNDYLTDTYSAVAADDDSPAMVGDPDRVASFELLPAFTCLYLEYEITKVSGASTVLVVDEGGRVQELDHAAHANRAGTVVARHSRGHEEEDGPEALAAGPCDELAHLADEMHGRGDLGGDRLLDGPHLRAYGSSNPLLEERFQRGRRLHGRGRISERRPGP